MVTAELLHKARITILLVRPKSPGNIGSVARAMQNMGLSRLTLVAPERFPHPEARMMACDAQDILQQAQIYTTLPEAIAPCHWLVGTSARRRIYRKPPMTPREFSQQLLTVPLEHQVGIVFGPEDTGLTTVELDVCHDRVVIPTVATATSLNLAQAVMVVCYEIMLGHYQTPSHAAPPLASVADIEDMYEHLQEALSIHGLPGPHTMHRTLIGLRRILERAGLERRDVRIIRGIARQLGWALRHPRRDGSS